ncbi:MAG TPA: hypothetical protein VER03_16290 [Bryobacteraceae bacterium]|nr:hypothetical protein [Bryobacteraceae bacterium]
MIRKARSRTAFSTKLIQTANDLRVYFLQNIIRISIIPESESGDLQQALRVRSHECLEETAYAAALEGFEQKDILGPCLSKPFRTKELQSAINRSLRGGQHGTEEDSRV